MIAAVQDEKRARSPLPLSTSTNTGSLGEATVALGQETKKPKSQPECTPFFKDYIVRHNSFLQVVKEGI
jgi:hypothetical protein